ncbi:MAG: sulfatase-like hydrolase/transferase [Candidatus Poribacteria bacterium]|nr:sulfatase-like hydrolase/transferase [Candidatus Poribacteria bacterium]
MSLTKTLTRWLMIVMLLSVDGLMTPAANAAQKPNIIYIMADDLGYGDLGCFGQEVIQTPNIDRLAFEGMRLTDHYAGNTVCRPSRLSLWTGMHPGHTAISSNAGYHFELSETTVAELLKKAGYATGGIGKWAMGGVGSGGHPNEHGFGYWFGYLDQGDAHNYYPTHLWENKTKFPLNGNVLMEHPQARGRVADKRVTYSHDVMTEKGLAWIVEHADRRFLFHFHYTIPHANNEGGRVTGDGMEVLFWRFRDKSAVRFGDWKAVQLEPDSPIELYDLHNDMGEEHDLADQHPFLVADLKAIMQKAYDPPQWKK